jgi:hypothetical protein
VIGNHLNYLVVIDVGSILYPMICNGRLPGHEAVEVEADGVVFLKRKMALKSDCDDGSLELTGIISC